MVSCTVPSGESPYFLVDSHLRTQQSKPPRRSSKGNFFVRVRFGGVPSPVEVVVQVRFCCLLSWKTNTGNTGPNSTRDTVLMFGKGMRTATFQFSEVWRLIGWPGPLLNCLSRTNPYQTSHSLNASPLSLNNPHFHRKVLRRIPSEKSSPIVCVCSAGHDTPTQAKASKVRHAFVRPLPSRQWMK